MKNTHKRGDTFDYSDRLEMSIDGVAVADFAGMAGASQIRTTAGALVASLEFSWLSQSEGLYRVRSIGSTDDWPVGVLLHDVQLTTLAGDVVSTATEAFQLVGDVTRVS